MIVSVASKSMLSEHCSGPGWPLAWTQHCFEPRSELCCLTSLSLHSRYSSPISNSYSTVHNPAHSPQKSLLQTNKSTWQRQIAHQELGAIHCVQGYAALLPNLTLGTISRKSSLSSSPSLLTISDSSPTSFRHQTEKSLFLGNASKIPNMASFAAYKLSLKAIGRGFTWQPPLPCHIMWKVQWVREWSKYKP